MSNYNTDTFNFVVDGLKRTDIESVKTMTAKRLSFLLGTNGNSRYNDNQLKTTKKERIVTELINEIEAADPIIAEPVTTKRTRKAKAEGEVAGPRGAAQKVSKNVACAASKYTNLLKALRAGTRTVEQLWAAYDFDTVLQAYKSREVFEAAIVAAQGGLSPKLIRSDAAAQRRAAAELERANRPARVAKTVSETVEVEIPDNELAEYNLGN